jgi:hypothetical protein
MKESFFQRWSRLKLAGGEPPAPEAADLPPVESLDFSSDFAPFLRADVEESVKRAALARLFHSGEFNRMDGLDVYVDDYGVAEPIPEEALQGLVQRVRAALQPEERPGEATKEQTGSAESAPEPLPPPAAPAGGGGSGAAAAGTANTPDPVSE